MDPAELKARTYRFGLGVIRLVRHLPADMVCGVIGRQLLRSATSVGANYRAACRARSNEDFIAKLKIVEEEADESMYWLELLKESGLANESLVRPSYQEADELLRIFVSSLKTLRTRQVRRTRT